MDTSNDISHLNTASMSAANPSDDLDAPYDFPPEAFVEATDEVIAEVKRIAAGGPRALLAHIHAGLARLHLTLPQFILMVARLKAAKAARLNHDRASADDSDEISQQQLQPQQPHYVNPSAFTSPSSSESAPAGVSPSALSVAEESSAFAETAAPAELSDTQSSDSTPLFHDDQEFAASTPPLDNYVYTTGDEEWYRIVPVGEESGQGDTDPSPELDFDFYGVPLNSLRASPSGSVCDEQVSPTDGNNPTSTHIHESDEYSSPSRDLSPVGPHSQYDATDGEVALPNECPPTSEAVEYALHASTSRQHSQEIDQLEHVDDVNATTTGGYALSETPLPPDNDTLLSQGPQRPASPPQPGSTADVQAPQLAHDQDPVAPVETARLMAPWEYGATEPKAMSPKSRKGKRKAEADVEPDAMNQPRKSRRGWVSGAQAGASATSLASTSADAQWAAPHAGPSYIPLLGYGGVSSGDLGVPTMSNGLYSAHTGYAGASYQPNEIPSTSTLAGPSTVPPTAQVLPMMTYPANDDGASACANSPSDAPLRCRWLTSPGHQCTHQFAADGHGSCLPDMQEHIRQHAFADIMKVAPTYGEQAMVGGQVRNVGMSYKNVRGQKLLCGMACAEGSMQPCKKMVSYGGIVKHVVGLHYHM
ncbi:hypothetical protein HDZ31DRAFT_76133 [Schizophyllum fasciatum]